MWNYLTHKFDLQLKEYKRRAKSKEKEERSWEK